MLGSLISQRPFFGSGMVMTQDSSILPINGALSEELKYALVWPLVGEAPPGQEVPVLQGRPRNIMVTGAPGRGKTNGTFASLQLARQQLGEQLVVHHLSSGMQTKDITAAFENRE